MCRRLRTCNHPTSAALSKPCQDTHHVNPFLFITTVIQNTAARFLIGTRWWSHMVIIEVNFLSYRVALLSHKKKEHCIKSWHIMTLDTLHRSHNSHNAASFFSLTWRQVENRLSVFLTLAGVIMTCMQYRKLLQSWWIHSAFASRINLSQTSCYYICVAEIFEQNHKWLHLNPAFIREMRSFHSDIIMQVLSKLIRLTPKAAAQQ